MDRRTSATAQAALAFRLYRVAATFSHVSAKCVTSSKVEFHPKLTRMAPAASAGSTPMASSTCERRTLPEEQAEPDDTATPARSKAISAVSALRPGTAKAQVLGSREAPEPKTTASGAICLSRASASSRSAPSRADSNATVRATRSAATPKPAIAATFSVPARRPLSCPPPRRSRVGHVDRSGVEDDGAHSLRAADLVRREGMTSTPSAARLDRQSSPPPEPHRCASSRPARARSRQPRRWAESSPSRCWRA